MKIKAAFHKLLFGKVDKNFYLENRTVLNNTNYTILINAAALAAVICGLLTVFALFVPIMRPFLSIYGFYALFNLLLIIVLFRFVKNRIHLVRAFYGIFALAVFSMAAIIGIFKNENHSALIYLVFIIMVPVLYVDKPLVSSVVALVSTGAFCVFVYAVKINDMQIVLGDIINALCCCALSIGFNYIITNIQLENIQAKINWEYRSMTDKLTGLSNKAAAEYLCDLYLKHNPGSECVMFAIDIDDFKSINDRYGHLRGDSVLKQVGACIRSSFREEDVMGRIGGDEFIVLMKNSVGGLDVINKKARMLSKKFKDIQPEGVNLTCSVGIAVKPANEASDYIALFEKADAALYKSKRGGKNRCFIENESDFLIAMEKDTMLIVDDSEISRTILKAAFEDEFHILEAGNGEEALKLMKSRGGGLAVILLDIVMPVMDGYRVLDEKRSDPALKGIPVIVITADNANELKALELGAADMVTKPFELAVVKMRVANAVSGLKDEA